MIFVNCFTPAHFNFLKIYPKKARKSRHFKPKISHFGHFHSFNWNYIPIFICICSLYTLSMGKTWFNLTKNWIILPQLDQNTSMKWTFTQVIIISHKRCLWCLWQIWSLAEGSGRILPKAQSFHKIWIPTRNVIVWSADDKPPCSESAQESSTYFFQTVRFCSFLCIPCHRHGSVSFPWF